MASKELAAARKSTGKRKLDPEPSIPKLAFRRLVQEISAKIHPELRYQREATDALQEAAERVLVQHFGKCSKLAELCHKDTLRREHWRFIGEHAGERAHTLLG